PTLAMSILVSFLYAAFGGAKTKKKISGDTPDPGRGLCPLHPIGIKGSVEELTTFGPGDHKGPPCHSPPPSPLRVIGWVFVNLVPMGLRPLHPLRPYKPASLPLALTLPVSCMLLLSGVLLLMCLLCLSWYY